MGWMVSQDTYVRTVKNSDGEEAVVTYRHLSGFERNSIQAMRGGDDGGAELDLGHMKARAVELAVVRWSLPFDPTRENIIRLEGPVFDRLFEYVSLDGKEPPEESGDADVPLGDSASDTPAGEPTAVPA